MKKLLVLVIAVTLLAILLPGCDGGPDAETVLKNSLNASKEDIKSVHFELTQVTKLPRAPMSEGGEIQPQEFEQNASGSYDLVSGNFEVETTVQIEDRSLQVKMRQVEGKQYWEIAGNWYEVPVSSEIVPSVTQALSVSQYLKEFETIEKLGDENIDDDSCYHIRAIPNMEELVKQPGVTDLLKDPSGEQVRTVDELKEMDVTFDFYIRKQDNYFKRSVSVVKSKAPNEFIKLGYAQPGDQMEQEATVTFSNFNDEVQYKVPENIQPLPEQLSGQ